jgi:hypothetical protein
MRLKCPRTASFVERERSKSWKALRGTHGNARGMARGTDRIAGQQRGHALLVERARQHAAQDAGHVQKLVTGERWLKVGVSRRETIRAYRRTLPESV